MGIELRNLFDFVRLHHDYDVRHRGRAGAPE
jgi:hypothetical protein